MRKNVKVDAMGEILKDMRKRLFSRYAKLEKEERTKKKKSTKEDMSSHAPEEVAV